MKERARSIGSYSRIVDGFIIRRGVKAEILRLREGIRESHLCIDVEDARCNLVAAAIPPAIENKFPVAADVFKSHAGGMVWRPGEGVDKELIGSVRGAPDVELEKILAGSAFAEKIAAAALYGRFIGVCVEELGEAGGQLGAAGKVGKRCLSTFLFGGNPCTSLPAILIFEPAIRIGDDGAAVSVLCGIDTRRGRAFWGWRGILLLSGSQASKRQVHDDEEPYSQHVSRRLQPPLMPG
jgi:hypothetical protein